VIAMTGTGKVTRLLAASLLLSLALCACRQTPDEEQIRQAIAAVSSAAEAGSASGVVEPLSEDFDGNDGQLDRRALGNMMRLVKLRGQHVGVTIGPIAIEHRGERIVATFTAGLSSGSGGLLPSELGFYRVETAWRQEDGDWRCDSASWKRAVAG
jgi:hypothetical protein